jgi:carboxymethylenebutenolidase
MITFEAGEQTGTAYLALPERGHGPGVLVLHAWWGLNSFFKETCDRLAREGFVALAPDLYFGKTAATIDEAQALLEQRDSERMKSTATGALAYLHDHPAVRGDAVGALGFSMGGAWAIFLSTLAPAELAAVVVFYGCGEADFAAARAAYQGHFAEGDEWEPDEEVHQMQAAMRAAEREVTFYTYPGVKHWFFEANRPEYDRHAAELAWQRTGAFLHERLAG